MRSSILLRTKLKEADFSLLSSTLEEITDEYMLNVVTFFVQYQLKDSLSSFLSDYFKVKKTIQSTDQRATSPLKFTEYINEENLSMRGIVEEDRDSHHPSSSRLKKKIYKIPFMKPFTQYTSQMQMDLRFKYYICKELGLGVEELVKEENSKAKTVYRVENSASSIDSRILSSVFIEKVSYHLEKIIPIPQDIQTLTKKIVMKSDSISPKIRALALALDSNFLQPVDRYFEKLSQVRFGSSRFALFWM